MGERKLLVNLARPCLSLSLLGCLTLQSLLASVNGSELMAVHHGESVTLQCPVNTAMGPGVRKMWRVARNHPEESGESVILVRHRYQKGVTWNEDAKAGKALGGAAFSLTVRKSTFRDSGVYTCEVQSDGVRRESTVHLTVFIRPQLFLERENNCTSEKTLLSTVTCTVPRTFPKLPPWGLVMRWGDRSEGAQESETVHGAFKYTVAHQVAVTETTAAVTVTCMMSAPYQQGQSRAVTIRPTDVLSCDSKNTAQTVPAVDHGVAVTSRDSDETDSIRVIEKDAGRMEPVMEEGATSGDGGGVPILGLALGIMGVVAVSLVVSAVVVSYYRRRQERCQPPKVNMPQAYSESGAVRYVINDKGPFQANPGHFPDTYLAPEHFRRDGTPQFHREKELLNGKIRCDSDSDEEGIYSMPDLPPIPVPPVLPSQQIYTNMSCGHGSSLGRR